MVMTSNDKLVFHACGLQEHWWKLREAALLALGSCGAMAEELAGGRPKRGQTGPSIRERLQRLVDDVIARDLQVHIA